MWVDAEMAQLELPLPRAKYSLRPVSAEYYYRMQVRPVYRTYPVYAAGREPAGYIERLSKEAPADAFDPVRLERNRIGFAPANSSSTLRFYSRLRSA